MPATAPETMMRPTTTFRCAAALLAVGLSASAFAQTAIPAPRNPARGPGVARSAPPLPAAPTAPFEVKGFRSASFGMTPAQVRAAIAKDFGSAKVTETANLAEGTTALQTALAKLEPGPGSAMLTYIFGATSKRLTHVNIVWSFDGEPSTEQRASIVTAAVQLTSYFQSLPTPKATTGVTPAGPNGLVMFAAVDTKGAAVEVSAHGISYQANAVDGSSTPAPMPKGPALLRISYVANAANPDIQRIKPNAF